MPGVEAWNLTVLPTLAAVSDYVANVVTETLRSKPDAVIVLPTGSTPLPLFDILSARAARGEIDFSHVQFFSLDDYLGLNGTEPNSLTNWLRNEFINRVNLDPARVHLAPAGASDPERAARDYDQLISQVGGIDLMVLGIGGNGHVAFNEPGASEASRTRVVSLTPETQAQAAAYWHNELDIPPQAMTMGIANMLEARRIILIASGYSKADALRRTVEEPISADMPASLLRHAGDRFEIVADGEAASQLTV